ncbi:hypothetical protein [Pseudophaeobacter arcticus]|nr:hypothetical protein [Pseudophaeobacter arcticus]
MSLLLAPGYSLFELKKKEKSRQNAAAQGSGSGSLAFKAARWQRSME